MGLHYQGTDQAAGADADESQALYKPRFHVPSDLATLLRGVSENEHKASASQHLSTPPCMTSSMHTSTSACGHNTCCG